MKDSEALIKARALIEDPAHWTRNAFWRGGPDGDRIGATQFCAVGALLTVTNHPTGWDQPPAAEYLKAEAPNCNVIGFNDHATHADVLRMYDRAIKNARRAERASLGWRRFLPWQK